jgi:hypothetical protein
MQLPAILTATVYALAAIGMVLWAWFHLERRHEETRRIERIQQLLVVLHFVLLAGWFLRYRIGLTERGADLTPIGTVFEVSGAVSSFLIAATSILLNPGMGWNRFFSIYAGVALVHGAAFGAIALRWPKALGLVPSLEEVIRDRESFGSPDAAGAPLALPATDAETAPPAPQH